jgi:hypothetical protein
MAGAREPLMKVREVAAYFGLEYGEVLDLIHAEEADKGSGLIAYNVGKGSQKVYRVRPRDVERFLDSRKAAA